MRDIAKLLDFIKFTNDFKKVERVIYVPGSPRYENDAEHSYQLALVAWYLVTTEKLPLDLTKVLTYAIVHDLVEVYAGDMPLFGRTEEMQSAKKKREYEALERIHKEFPEFPDLISSIKNYEERADEESIFVHALDKLIPPMNIYTDGGRSWKERGITLERELKVKKDSTAASPVVHAYWDLLAKIFVEHPDLFAPPTSEK